MKPAFKPARKSAVRGSRGWMGVLLLVCALMAWPSFATAQVPELADASALVIPAGTTYSGDVGTVSQSIIVDGVVEGDVTSVTGSIVIRGAVEGDVVSLFGNVTFAAESVADGNVMAATGIVSVPAGASVAANKTVFNGNLSGQGMASLLPRSGEQPLNLAGRMILSLALGLIALVVATLLSVIWPRSIASGARAVRVALGRTVGLGVLWMLLSLALVAVITLVLVFSLIGLAVLPVVLLIAQVPYLIGLAAVGQALGERFGLHRTQAVVAGSAAILLPCVGLAIISLPAAFGLFYMLAGAGIGGMFLLRAAVVQRNSVNY
jgi:hypothetical protein